MKPMTKLSKVKDDIDEINDSVTVEQGECNDEIQKFNAECDEKLEDLNGGIHEDDRKSLKDLNTVALKNN